MQGTAGLLLTGVTAIELSRALFGSSLSFIPGGLAFGTVACVLWSLLQASWPCFAAQRLCSRLDTSFAGGCAFGHDACGRQVVCGRHRGVGPCYSKPGAAVRAAALAGLCAQAGSFGSREGVCCAAQPAHTWPGEVSHCCRSHTCAELARGMSAAYTQGQAAANVHEGAQSLHLSALTGSCAGRGCVELQPRLAHSSPLPTGQRHSSLGCQCW